MRWPHYSCAYFQSRLSERFYPNCPYRSWGYCISESGLYFSCGVGILLFFLSDMRFSNLQYYLEKNLDAREREQEREAELEEKAPKAKAKSKMSKVSSWIGCNLKSETDNGNLDWHFTFSCGSRLKRKRWRNRKGWRFNKRKRNRKGQKMPRDGTESWCFN